jgi:RNA ligase (TIGR02306 family)
MSGEIHSQIEKYKFQAPKNYKNYFHLLQEGEEIIITEKIHGTNFVIRAEKEEFYVGSRNYFWELNSPKNKGNIYIKAFEQFKELQYLPPGVTVYGEIYGVQDLKYGLENGAIDYAIFSVVKNNEYLNYDDFKSFCYIFKLKTAPELYRGQYSKEVVLNFNNKNSVLEPSQIMEGVVISPLYERYDPIIGRVSLKYISDKYLLRKGGTELH